MGVVTDMVGAVAIVAAAAGAVTELQVRISHIGAAADGAAVIVSKGGLGSRFGLLVGEGDGLGGFARGRLGCPGTVRAGTKTGGQKVQHVLAGKQQELSREDGPGGTVTIHAVVDGMTEKYVFTPI